MAVIKSGASTDQLTVDPTSKAARVTMYDSSGNEILNSSDALTSISLAALNATHEQHLDNYNGIGFTITNMGNAANRIIAEMTFDTINWVQCLLIDLSTNNSISTITSTGSYTIRFAGGTNSIRLKVSSYTSGTITGGMTASTAISQNNIIRGYDNVLSPFNSTTAQLTAGSTFTGTWEADLLWVSSVMSVLADQNLTIVLEQSHDGSTIVNSDTFTYRANATNWSQVVQLTTNYHRVKITNNGGSTTTTLSYQMYNCPVFLGEPRTLTLSGNKRVEIPDKQTYRVANVGLAPIAGNTFTLAGSTTKTIRITRISYTFQSADNTVDYIDVQLLKLSALSGGTSATQTAVPLDSQNAAATATARFYTVAPTTATSLGAITSRRYLSLPANATAGVIELAEINFGNSISATSPIVLRGTSEAIALNLSAIGGGGGQTMSLVVEWIEE